MEAENLEKEIEKISVELANLKKKVENMENFFKSFFSLALLRKNNLEKEIISKVKNDENAFKNFMELVEKNRRDILASILKRKILERCEELK